MRVAGRAAMTSTPLERHREANADAGALAAVSERIEEVGDELSDLLVAYKSDYALDEALAAVKADGRLAAAWEEWLPSLESPFAAR